MFKRSTHQTVLRRAALFGALAVVATTSLAASPAFAISPGMTDGTAPDSIVQKAHFCHRSCELGYIPRWGVSRWHRHYGPDCLPARCAPLAPHPNRCWIDAYGVRHCRW